MGIGDDQGIGELHREDRECIGERFHLSWRRDRTAGKLRKNKSRKIERRGECDRPC